jgi:hypothetical protein
VETYYLNNLEVTIDKEGARRFAKVTYPIRYGRFCEIKTPNYLFQFNLNGEIKYIRGLSRSWPHPAEWLKRTDADDWVFYSVGGYNGIYYLIGEYYLPCLPYRSNSIWTYNPFIDANIQQAFTAWTQLLSDLSTFRANGIPPRIKNFLSLISRHYKHTLNSRSKSLHRIVGGQISVLPPDTRHVDYEVIPLMIADGCLYHCDFCCIKTSQKFQPRAKDNILQQIQELQSFYGDNLSNYNALFLGNHDALAAGHELICMAAADAYFKFDFETSHVKGPTLFLFGSVDSLLAGGETLIEAINRLPYYTYVNVGFESADAATLLRLNKPLEINKIEDAFQMMHDVNRSYHNIEITANFLLEDRFPPNHYRSLIELVRNRLDRFYSKGALYLSPLNTSQNNRELIRKFVEIKNLSRLPTYLYLIQRL